jgi:hypothetical protein
MPRFSARALAKALAILDVIDPLFPSWCFRLIFLADIFGRYS